jgi:hypothetical protein
VHFTALVDRDIFADDETLVGKVIADLVGLVGFAVLVETPAAARPVHEMTMPVLFVRTLAHDPAGFAMFSPNLCVDAVL